MSKRLILVLFAMLLPFTAAADDGTSAAGLGPQANGPGSSTADSSTLQPAGLAPIQSAPTSAANLGAPSDVLQAPTTPDANLTVLAGEADGEPHDVAGKEEAPSWPWALAAVVLSALIGAAVVYRDRRRFQRLEP